MPLPPISMPGESRSKADQLKAAISHAQAEVAIRAVYSGCTYTLNGWVNRSAWAKAEVEEAIARTVAGRMAARKLAEAA